MPNNFTILRILWHLQYFWGAYFTIGIFFCNLLLIILILQNMIAPPQPVMISTNWGSVDCVSPR